MKKLLDWREWLGTGIQLMIFALLIPFIAFFFGIMKEAAPEAMNDLVSAFTSWIIEKVPFAETIQDAALGYNLIPEKLSVLEYGYVVFMTVTEDMLVSSYIGAWLFAFRIIFKESIAAGFLQIKGLPILQTVCGLFFGVLTLPLLYGNVMIMAVAILFMTTMLIVISIIFVHKAVWKKLLDLLINLSFQCFLTGLTIGYVTVVVSLFCGYYRTITEAVFAVATVLVYLLGYLVLQYLIIEK